MTVEAAVPWAKQMPESALPLPSSKTWDFARRSGGKIPHGAVGTDSNGCVNKRALNANQLGAERGISSCLKTSLEMN